MADAMTDERLAEIKRANHDLCQKGKNWLRTGVVNELIAEVERLRAEVVDLRAQSPPV